MNGLEWNTSTSPNAAADVASALAPKQKTQSQSTHAMDTSGGTTSGSSSSSTGDITSDDFLTLLVSELKNQDPTQPTDPNAYITQLTEVNSLQQLIQINQGVGDVESAFGITGSTSSGS